MAGKFVEATYPSYDIHLRRLPVEKFAPSIWADTFTSFSFDVKAQEKRSKAVESLKEKVREMIIAGGSNALNDKLILIDTLERLGLAYHFKHEIEEQLESISNHSEHHDLYISALRFRILRQHHHRVSLSVFNKFTDKDGKFDEILSRDVKGLLSLFEASQVRIHGEDILEEGLAFTTHHLNVLVPTLKCPLQEQVKRALEQPLHRVFSRIEVRKYISFYERDSSHNKVILELAILDFNYLQNLYKKELCDLCRWWKNIDLISKLSFARDRVPELYFWGLVMYFKPEDSFSRIAVAKCTIITSILDDMYDNYATVEEAEAFTKSLQRWDIDEIDRLPDYMKVVYKFILSTYEDLVCEASKRGRSFAAPYVREVIQELSLGYNNELKWFLGIKMPTLEAYNDNIIITSTVYLLSTPALLGMKSATDEVFHWLHNRPKFVLAAARIGRFLDDLGSHQREGREGQMLTAVTMYMKLHGVTKQEALAKFAEIVEDSWKEINSELCNLPSYVPPEVAIFLLNFARATEIFYKNSEDGYTCPEKGMAPQMADLLVHPIVF
ncbi:cis-muuroladiene synthase-like [Andrographis paniculata]|uniref:cis-muuroladiene synthase-like n=1 Tax=Andrographis paniculata TaxID=175694 RepID=UPI0021E78600|nr:cis-muuroladiene synthase-like [Andrographis paniculata]QJA18334.1 terpene synthase 19 [Andrographis paniculata]